MQGIEILLRKYASLKPRDMVVKECFIKTFIEVFGEDVSAPKVEVSNYVLRVCATGPLKSELHLRKEELEKAFFQNLEKGFWAGDIR